MLYTLLDTNKLCLASGGLGGGGGTQQPPPKKKKKKNLIDYVF